MPISVAYNVEYTIPRVNLSMPGRQNRCGDGILRVTPGVTEPYEFIFGNVDGVVINLTGFTAKLIFWSPRQSTRDDALRLGQSEIVLAKSVDVQDPAGGRCLVLLEDDDTLVLGNYPGRLRWSLYLINDQGQVFPMQVTRSGNRYGTVDMDLQSGIPIAELVRSANS